AGETVQHCTARRRLGPGCDGVLQIQADHVGFAAQRLVKSLRSAAGHEQQRPRYRQGRRLILTALTTHGAASAAEAAESAVPKLMTAVILNPPSGPSTASSSPARPRRPTSW